MAPRSTIVVLNGTSSSGKSTIARALQEIAPGVLLNFSIDTILYALPPSRVQRLERGEPDGDIRLPDLVRAFYACVAELAALGHDLVIDHAVTSAAEAEMLRAAIDGHRTLLVGLECPVDVLAAREEQRGNRRRGMARAQSALVHRWLDYDLVIDTSAVSAGEAARRIAAALRKAT